MGVPPLEQEYETIDLREVFAILRKNLIWLILSAVVFAVAGYFATALLITPQYEASATLIVNSREGAQQQTAVTNDQINSAKQLVDTYAVILKSDTVLQRTIDELALDMDYGQLVEKVTISSVNSTQVMKVAVRDPDAKVAQNIVANIVEQAPTVIVETVNAGSVKIVSQPSAGQDPVSPNKMTNTAVAGLLGLVLAVGIVFLRSMMNNTFTTDKDINQHLGITVLGVIPQIQIQQQ